MTNMSEPSGGPQRFMVLCGPRTGSNMLTSALHSHPEIVCFREVFNFTLPSIDYNVAGFDGKDPEALALRKRDPAAFMDRCLFSGHAPSIHAVGFKFIYEHFWDSPGLIEALQARPGLRVIHLKRRNGVRAFLSYKMAFATGSWQQPKPRPVHQRLLSTLAHPERIPASIRRRVSSSDQPLRIALPPAECLEYIDLRIQQEAHFDALFAANERLEIAYEDMVADRQRQFRRAQDFLGVEPRTLNESVERQNPGRMADLVANYDELSLALRQTPHAWMLDGQ